MDIKSKIRTVPDFPKKGILYYDITTLLQDPKAFQHVIKKLLDYYTNKEIDVIASAESRGFIFGSILAHDMNASFVPLRKPGKLPHKTIRQDFETEYSSDGFEIHMDAVKKGDKVLIVDDLLATGGTSKAACKLVEKLGGIVIGLAFIIELGFLNGRKNLKGYDILSLINYDQE
jgi:adenine phosphoribosyltransferase